MTKELCENRRRSRSSLSQSGIESSGSRVKTQKRSRDAWLLAGCLRAAIHQHPTRRDDLGLVRPLRSVGCFWLAASDVQLQAGIKPGEPGIRLDWDGMQGRAGQGRTEQQPSYIPKLPIATASIASETVSTVNLTEQHDLGMAAPWISNRSIHGDAKRTYLPMYEYSIQHVAQVVWHYALSSDDYDYMPPRN